MNPMGILSIIWGSMIVLTALCGFFNVLSGWGVAGLVIAGVIASASVFDNIDFQCVCDKCHESTEKDAPSEEDEHDE